MLIEGQQRRPLIPGPGLELLDNGAHLSEETTKLRECTLKKCFILGDADFCKAIDQLGR